MLGFSTGKRSQTYGKLQFSPQESGIQGIPSAKSCFTHTHTLLQAHSTAKQLQTTSTGAAAALGMSWKQPQVQGKEFHQIKKAPELSQGAWSSPQAHSLGFAGEAAVGEGEFSQKLKNPLCRNPCRLISMDKFPLASQPRS